MPIEFVITVATYFRRQYGGELPTAKTIICNWLNYSNETGSVLKAKSPGRPRTVELIRVSCVWTPPLHT